MIADLSTRDRNVLIGGGIVVLLLVLVFGVVLPYRSALDGLDARIASRREQLRTVQQLQQLIRRQQTVSNEVEQRLARGRGVALVTVIETLAKTVAGKENLVAMRPQPVTPPQGLRQEQVEVKFERLRLDQLVRFLHALDGAEGALQVGSLKVRKRFDDKTLLDATLVVSAFAKGT